MKNKGLGEIALDRLDLRAIEGVFGGGLWRGAVVRGGVSANYGKPVKTLRLNFFWQSRRVGAVKVAGLGYDPG